MQAQLKTEASQFAVLLRNISRAEKYYQTHPEEPYHAALECRRFLEHLAYLVARRHGVALRGKAGAKEELHAFLERLKSEGCFPEIQSVLANQIRITGNSVHIDKFIRLSDAEAAIANSKRLADWFENTSASPLRGTTAETMVRQPNAASTASSNSKVVQFPKRDDMSTLPQERSSPPPLNQHQRPADTNVTAPGRWTAPVSILVILISALIGWRVWDRGYVLGTSSRYEAFTQAQPYAVVPGAGAAHVNERGGPGTTFPILGQLDRGASVLGIGRAHDADNASWIALSDGRGYVKETLLSPSVAAPAPTPTVVPAPPPADASGVPNLTTADGQPSPSTAASSSPENLDGQTQQFVGQGRAGGEVQTTAGHNQPSVVPALLGLTLQALLNRHGGRLGSFERRPMRQYGLQPVPPRYRRPR